MMRPTNDLPVVYLCRDAIDFRKGINGLAVLVEDTLSLDPFSEQLFVFCNGAGPIPLAAQASGDRGDAVIPATELVAGRVRYQSDATAQKPVFLECFVGFRSLARYNNGHAQPARITAR